MRTFGLSHVPAVIYTPVFDSIKSRTLLAASVEKDVPAPIICCK